MNVSFAACANLLFDATHKPLNFGIMASLRKSRTPNIIHDCSLSLFFA